MARDATLTIKIAADSSRANAELRKTSQGIGGFTKNLIGTGVRIAAWGAAAGAAIGGVAYLTANMASDQDEARNKVNVVFGRMAGDIQDFAKDSAKAFGMSEAAALGALGTYGNLFDAMGIGPKKNAAMSESLVTLAADLASFNNIDPAEALDKLRAGLVGEAEPLRTLGVNISETRTKAEALRLGLIKEGGALDAAAKAQANYSLIMKDTANAQGDFARTSGGMANQQRILAATFQNAMADIGAAFVPLIEKILPVVVGLLEDFAAWFTANGPMISDVGGQVAALLGAAFDFLSKNVIPALIDAFEWFVENVLPRLVELFDWIVANVIPPLIEAFAGIAVWLKENGPTIARIFETTFGVLIAVLKVVWPIVVSVARILFPLLGKAASILLKIIDYVFQAIAIVVRALLPVVRVVAFGIIGVWRTLAKLWMAVFEFIEDAIDAFVKLVVARWTPVGKALTKPFQDAIDIIRGVFRTITSIVQGAVRFITGILDGISETIAGFVEALPGDQARTAAPPAARAARAPRVGYAGATSVPAAAMPSAAGRSTESGRAGAVTINIHGAVDPEGTARQVARLLAQHGIRTGRASTLITGQTAAI